MTILEQIQREVEIEANDPEVILQLLLDRLKGPCPKKVALYVYVRRKLSLARHNKWNLHYYTKKSLRELCSVEREKYYTTPCNCGKCNPKHNKERYYNGCKCS